MTRYAIWLGAALAAIVVLAIAVLAAVPYLVDLPRVQALIAGTASHALGRPVKFASVSVRALPLPAVELRQLEVAEDPRFGSTPFLRMDRGLVRLRLWPLLTGHVEFGQVVLDKPQATLIQDASGRWNIASLGANREARGPSRPSRGGGTAAAAPVLGSRVELDHGTVIYEARGASGALSKYRVEDLGVTVRNEAGQVRFEGKARVTPGDVALRITDGTVSLSNVRTLGDAPVRARLTFDGKDVKDLAAAVAGPSPALSGGLTGALAVSGTVAKPHASGEVQLAKASVTETRAACPEPKRRSLAIPELKLGVALDEGRLAPRPLSARVADGTITGNLGAVLEPAMRVELSRLSIRGLALQRVLVDFLCETYAVNGPLDLDGRLAFRPSDLWRSADGDGRLHIGPGKVIGAQALDLLAGVARLVGPALGGADPTMLSVPTDFDSITGTYRIDHGVVTTRDLLYTARTTKVAVVGTYALATTRLDLDVRVQSQQHEVQAKVTGTTASPSVRVVPAALLRQLPPPADVEKGLKDLLKRFR